MNVYIVILFVLRYNMIILCETDGFDMNKLSEMFLNIKDGETVLLKKDEIYHVRQDDSFELEGFYCSNTAKSHENPNGLRRTAVYLNGKKNVTIDGNGATIMVHGKMTPLLFYRCENITVRNLVIDYACPTMTEFRVVSNNDGDCILEINKECLYKIEDNCIVWHGETGEDGAYYWQDSYIGNRRHNKIYDPATQMCRDFRRDDLEFELIEELAPCRIHAVLRKKDADLPAGCVFQTRNIIRDQTGSMFERCRNLRFENLRIRFMHGLGMVSQFCENVNFVNCDLTPAEGRTVASTADFFQFSGCRGDIIIDNCKAQGAHDDYINVHGTHLRIVSADEKEKSLVVRFMHAESWGFQAFEAGDELEFIKWDTLIPYASSTVVSHERINDTDIKLILSDFVNNIEIEKDVVENVTWTPDLYVRNCSFGPTSGRGILCTTRGEVIIENNRFRNLWGPALLLEDDCNFWFESGLTKEIVFRNNVVENCEYRVMWEGAPSIRYTPKVMNENSKEFVHGKLILKGNTFLKPHFDSHLFWLEYLGEAVVEDNVFDSPYEIKTNCVGKIIDRNNTVK